MSSSLTIVIPIYNDLASLKVLIEKINSFNFLEFRFIIVDNGSTNPEVFEAIKEGGQYWAGVRTQKNLGLGGGILFGIKSCSTPWVGWMPGNLKIDPLDLPQFLKSAHLTSNSLIKAHRVGRPFSDRVKTLIVGLIQSLLLLKKMNDSGGTPTICERQFIEMLRNPPMDYVFESYILFSAQNYGLSIQRPNIQYRKRLFGESHWQNGLKGELDLMKKIVSNSRSWR